MRPHQFVRLEWEELRTHVIAKNRYRRDLFPITAQRRRCYRQPGRIVLWLFARANSAEYREKKGLFYPFKDRFLIRFAVPDGYDAQLLSKRWFDRYDEDYYEDHDYWTVLQRWQIGGRVFHSPVGNQWCDSWWQDQRATKINQSFPEWLSAQNVFEGLLKRPKRGNTIGRLAFFSLLAYYNPSIFRRLIFDRTRDLRRMIKDRYESFRHKCQQNAYEIHYSSFRKI